MAVPALYCGMATCPGMPAPWACCWLNVTPAVTADIKRADPNSLI